MLNNLTIMGRMTRDPELRQTQSGIPVCSCCIAVERNYMTDGSRETDFFDVVVWRGTVGMAMRLGAMWKSLPFLSKRRDFMYLTRFLVHIFSFLMYSIISETPQCNSLQS